MDKRLMSLNNTIKGDSMEKREVTDAIAKALTDKIGSLNSALKGTRDRARDAPGSNVSHSDTSKFQLSNLALGIERQISECQQTLEQLKNVSAKKPGAKISIGSLFILRNIEGSEEKTFFLLYRGGGERVIVNEVEIMTLSVTAPIAQACLGKEIGDEVEHKNNTFEVIEVQ